MKIVNLEVFRKLPEGTIYSKYTPTVFDGLKIKGETWEYDFLYQELIGNIDANSSEEFNEICEKSQTEDIDLPLDFDCYERDGLFEKNQLFAIYNEKDIEALINRLKKSTNYQKLETKDIKMKKTDAIILSEVFEKIGIQFGVLDCFIMIRSCIKKDGFIEPTNIFFEFEPNGKFIELTIDKSRELED